MKIDHYDNDPKQSPTAQSLIQGEINALVTFWPDIRDDEAIGPEVAFDLLAIWAHLRRFDASTLDENLISRINVLVADDLEAICEQALRFPFPLDWPDIASRLDEAWDHVAEEEEVDELEHSLNEHFELLDRASLVAYALADLKPTTCGGRRLAGVKDVLHHAESYLADHPDVFLPAAVFASSMLDSYRHDLHEFDERLWETTLRHRAIQELVDEQQNPIAIPKMNRATAQLLMDGTLVGEATELRPIPVLQNDHNPLFGERVMEAFAEFDGEADIGFVELPSLSSSIYFEPQYAMPLQEPLNAADASEAPLRRWEQLRFSAGKIEWLKGKPVGVAEDAIIDIEWNSLSELVIQTNGLLRRGAEYSVKVSWKTETEHVVAEAESSRQLIPEPIRLFASQCEGPGQGDVLEITHAKFLGERKVWECFLRVPFK